MDGGVEEAFAAALRRLAVARIVFDVGHQASIENALPIACGIKAPSEVERGAFEVQPHFFGHLFQRFQALRCTFRTLFRPSEAIIGELPAETGGGAVYRLFHALQPIATTSFSP